ncbi:putative RNA methyltransferase [Actinophytocola sediminis]
MLTDVLPYLACPHCAATMTLAGAQLRCASGHGFDLARQGYVNLLSGKAAVAGDTAEMVAARAAFLSAGHYRPVTAALTAAVTAARPVVTAARPAVTAAVTAPTPAGCVADFGAGTGHYLAAVLDAEPDLVGLALEISKPALRRAARAHPNAGAVGCDVWAALPIRTAAISLALNVFAPRNPAELGRVIAPGGTLIVVSPTVEHLAGLVTDLGLLRVPPDKERQVTAALAADFEPSTQDVQEFELELSHDDVLSLVGMGPSAWHVGAEALGERVAALPEPVRVTASVLVASYGRA